MENSIWDPKIFPLRSVSTVLMDKNGAFFFLGRGVEYIFIGVLSLREEVHFKKP